MSFRKTFALSPIVFLLFAVAVFFWKALSFAGYYFHWDLISISIPIKEFFFHSVAKGSFTLWAPGMCCGFPIFAEGETGPLYLLNYPLFTFLPAHIALNLSVILHAILSIVGMYLYLGRSHTRGSAAVGAVGFAFSVYMIFHIVHIMFYQSACLIPWLFYFFDRYLSEGRKSDILLAVLVLVQMFSAGHQQHPVFAFAGFSIFGLVLGVEAWMSGRKKPALGLIGAGVVIALAAAISVSVILVSMYELVGHSVRKEAMPSTFLYTHSLQPNLLPRLASPLHNGSAATDTWLLPRNEKDQPVYLGLLAWLIVPLAFMGKSGRRDRAHLGVVLIGFLLILGYAGPFAGLFEHIPVMNRMRIPVRYMLPMTVSLAYLAASGMDKLRQGGWSARKAFLSAGAGAAAWAALAWGGAIFTYGKMFLSAGGNGAANADKFHLALAYLKSDLIFRSLLVAALLICATALAFAEMKKKMAAAPILLAVGLIVFCDLSSIGRRENPVIESSFFNPKDTVSFLQANLDGRRIYSTDNADQFGHSGWAKGTDSYLRGIEGLPQFTPMMFGIKTAVCDLPLDFARYIKVYRSMNQAWLRQMSIKYVLSRKELPWPVALDRGALRIFEIPDAPPIYSLASRVESIAAEEEAYAAVVRAGDEGVRTAFIEGYSGTLPESYAAVSKQDVRVLRDEPEFRQLQTESDAPSYLIIRETYYPGWMAFVDGTQAPIYRTNYLFSGLFVPAGTHEIVLSYRPVWFRPMIALNILCVLGFFAAAVFSKSLRRPAKAFLFDPEDAAAARKLLRYGLLLFLFLIAVAVVRHPNFWIV